MSFAKKAFGAAITLGAMINAAYTIQDDYDSTNFFTGFEFFSAADPTNGFVQYVDAATANSSALAGYTNGSIYLGVDYTTQDPASGRASVRVNTISTYTHGLFIADIAHMPVGCGTWPAWWTFGDDQSTWPVQGEIDVIEGVNSATSDTQTLHTSSGCTVEKYGYCNAGGGNDGCTTGLNNDTQSFGAGFNDIGGGYYAMEWTSSAITTWFFPRTGSVPDDITSGSPDPATWGTPTAQFTGPDCNIDDHFWDHKIVFDTTFCGDWAGAQDVWSADTVCSALADTCNDYVSANPSAFKDAYWLINSVKVYSDSSNTTSTRRVRRRF